MTTQQAKRRINAIWERINDDDSAYQEYRELLNVLSEIMPADNYSAYLDNLLAKDD